MNKKVLEFVNEYNEATRSDVLEGVKQLEGKLNDTKYDDSIGDIVWSYYDYTDKSLTDVAKELNDHSLLKKFFFEVWFLNETGEIYEGKMRNQSNNDLLFID